MPVPPDSNGSWTLVTFTDDPALLATLADLHGRTPNVRLVAVVSAPVAEVGDLVVLIDEGARLARQFGVSRPHSLMLDGRGTVIQTWSSFPEAEVLSLYGSRPALPSAVPPWLFPVLAAVVLVAALGAWAYTRAPAAALPPAPQALAAPAVGPAASPPEAIAPLEAVVGEAPLAENAPPGLEGKRGKGGKGKGGAAMVAGWGIAPRDQVAAVAFDEGGTLKLVALPGEEVTACRPPMPLKAPVTVSAEWKLVGFTGKPVRAAVRLSDAAGKPVKGPTGRVVVARGKGSADWMAISAEVKPVPGATQGRLCLDLDPGVGTVSIRKVVP